MGIAPEQRAKLGQPFSQLSSRMGRHYSQEGTGLGLYVTRRIIDTWGGTLTFSDNLPRGTCVLEICVLLLACVSLYLAIYASTFLTPQQKNHRLFHTASRTSWHSNSH